MEGDAELALDLLWQAVAVGVVQADLERLQPPQHRRADAPGGDRADLHALQVIRARDAVGDVPAAVDHPLVGGDVVAHEREDHHHHVLGDADAVRVRHLGDRQADARSPPAGRRGLSRCRPSARASASAPSRSALRSGRPARMAGRSRPRRRAARARTPSRGRPCRRSRSARGRRPPGTRADPSSPDTHPTSSPGVKPSPSGVGVLWPS